MGRLVSINQIKVYEFIKQNPKCTRKEISVMLDLPKDTLKLYINNLLAKRAIKKYPTDKIKPEKYVIASYDIESENPPVEKYEVKKDNMKHVTSTPIVVPVVAKKEKQLSDYTPRELMVELKKRGFTGKLKLIRIDEVDFEKL